MMEEFSLSEIAANPFVQTGLLALAGAAITHLLLRRYPARRLAFQLVFFVALTALLYKHQVVPYEVSPDTTPIYERTFAALAKIIWWINGAWVLIGCARVFLVFERLPHEGRLLQDLVAGLIYLGAALSIGAYVFKAPVGTLIATSGVFAIILGLALQSTLADVFSGIALNFSRVYEVGDWIVLGGDIEGRVVETNWRATHLLNGSNDLVVLPNSVLAKAQLTNLSSPNRNHGVKLRVRFTPTMAPSVISEVMRTVLLSSNSILNPPSPSVEIKSLDARAIELELSFRVTDYAASSAARHEVYDLIYRHAKAAGLSLAEPAEAVTVFTNQVAPAPLDVQTTAQQTTSQRLVDAVPLFVTLTPAERTALAETLTRKTYQRGEVLVAQGTRLDVLMIIGTGVVALSREEDGREIEQSRLAPGDYFGEAGLFTGSGETATARALTFTVIYEVGQAPLSKLMKERPGIADEISVTLSRRASAAMRAGEPGAETRETSISRLVGRIRQLFNVPHG
ncbi:cyclic nucleotide-binding domain-containing protein [Reyranella sp.]|uniref:cyclic nucleotide-binding domain-containing protein n=1 Tax=Reyranella sp. TaxID=1929291 RepID=UPI003C7C26B9